MDAPLRYLFRNYKAIVWNLTQSVGVKCRLGQFPNRVLVGLALSKSTQHGNSNTKDKHWRHLIRHHQNGHFHFSRQTIIRRTKVHECPQFGTFESTESSRLNSGLFRESINTSRWRMTLHRVICSTGISLLGFFKTLNSSHVQQDLQHTDSRRLAFGC